MAFAGGYTEIQVSIQGKDETGKQVQRIVKYDGYSVDPTIAQTKALDDSGLIEPRKIIGVSTVDVPPEPMMALCC